MIGASAISFQVFGPELAPTLYIYRFKQLMRKGSPGFFALYVFGDGLVEVALGGVGTELDKKGRYLGVMGAAGGLARGIQVSGRVAGRADAAEQLGGATDETTTMASGLEAAEAIPLSTIAEIRVEKGFLLQRRLVVKTADGVERTYTYTEKAHPVPTLSAVFGPLVGDRFHAPS